MSVDESSDDNLRVNYAAPYAPTDAWTQAFDAQCTDAMLGRLRRYALLLVRLPGGEQLGDPRAYVEELTQAVITDVVDGVLRWDPSTGDLEPYLADVIRLRVRRDRKRAARYQHLSLDATHHREHAALLDEVDRHLAASASTRSHEEDPRVWGAMTTTLVAARALVVDDPLALRFLDALEQEATTRSEIMKLAGFTRTEYYNTRRRLGRLLGYLHLGRPMPAKGN